MNGDVTDIIKRSISQIDLSLVKHLQNYKYNVFIDIEYTTLFGSAIYFCDTGVFKYVSFDFFQDNIISFRENSS